MSRGEDFAWGTLVAALCGLAAAAFDGAGGGAVSWALILLGPTTFAAMVVATDRANRRAARLTRDIQRLEEFIARDDYLLRPRRERAEPASELAFGAHFVRITDHAGHAYHKYDDGRMVLVSMTNRSPT